MPHGTMMKPGDKITISKSSRFWAGANGTIMSDGEDSMFGSEIVKWYLVEIELPLTPWITQTYSFPAPWLDKETGTCPMTPR